MQRSHMIAYLAEQINEKWDIPWSAYSGDPRTNQLEFFSDVLDLVEDKGMHPPNYEWEDEDEQ